MATEDEEQNCDPSEFTELGRMPQSAVGDENFIPVNVSSESQVLISHLVNNMKEDHFANSYGVPSKSLESHVIRFAMNEERTLIACYPSEEQIARSKGTRYVEFLELTAPTTTTDPEEFMTMQSFGPWQIKKEPHLRRLCLVLLAFLSAAEEVAV
ncbi:hypothetical protein CDV55_103259 [Aspergillus turcosus]|uniref:Uncharacterized protein n=1 Tax=Aspergillus turcosus TaxID=1245748 RepID=A0A229XEQ6_9EURO|nr:hypothetical protein CDV55_103259 [Aspergillus turcosus]RLL97294.1 hypothetical protein CFD26_103588 [Aspergillus turcosus]